ncbi:MAG: hypothetical protein HQ517_14850, partial [SAR324 cluster bacterium]|nr:hypothetical protein [SAR324 cluster bacterium]
LEVRQINNYSKDILVKMSRHGQKGCTSADIRKIFLENLNSASTPSSSKGKLNEIAIIMGYALLFARIPMMDQLVENIRNAIPNVNTDTTLYKQKIIIAQKISLLEISRALHKNDGSENFTKKLYLLALGVFKYCVSVIEENQLDRVNLKNDIYTYPLLKQAVIAITYKNIFRLHQESYLELLETSQKLLDAVKQCSSSGHPALAKMARNAEIYSKNINSIILQIQSENTAGYGKDDFGETHQNY